MIVDEYVEVSIVAKLIGKYKELGYADLKIGNKLKIKPEHLNPNSKIRVNCKCFHCGNIKEVSYMSYYNSTNITQIKDYYCKSCLYEKNKRSLALTYGEHITNVSQLETTQQAIKETSKEKYGVEHFSKSDIVKDKKTEKSLITYGVKCVFQNETIKEQIKATNLEIYGVENVSQLRNKTTFDKYSEIYKNEYKFLKYKDSIFEVVHHKCNKIFNIFLSDLNNRTTSNTCICTECYPIGDNKSIKEKELIEYIQSFGVETFESVNNILIDKKHLDIYIPSHNLAIEFNGLYYHSERFKEKDYHLNKSLECQEKGIFLMHIWEDEWIYKQDIVKSIISNRLGKIENKIYARKCQIKEVGDSSIVRNFLDDNHIQGYAQSSIKLGLYYENELVSLMTFGYRHTNSKKEFELIRFCNKLNSNVIGASSRLFKYFLNNYDYTEILSYSDFRLFDGKMYETLGFEKIHLSKPDYFWCKDKKRSHRFNYNKKKLVKEGYDASKTEVEIMHERGYYRIFSCGQIRWVYNKQK